MIALSGLASPAVMLQRLNLVASRTLSLTANRPLTVPAKVNLSAAFAKINEPWSPHVCGEVNECQLKLAKMSGEFVWHHHEEEDECFIVINGKMRMQFRDGNVDCNPGELVVVPKGVEHCPMALSEPCEVLLVERGSTLNTGSAADALGDAVHELGSVPLTKHELKRV